MRVKETMVSFRPPSEMHIICITNYCLYFIDPSAIGVLMIKPIYLILEIKYWAYKYQRIKGEVSKNIDL